MLEKFNEFTKLFFKDKDLGYSKTLTAAMQNASNSYTYVYPQQHHKEEGKRQPKSHRGYF